MASNAENVSIWWRHHIVGTVVMTTCYMNIMRYYKRRCRVHVQTIAAVQTGTATENNSGRQFVQQMSEFYRRQINEDKRIVMNSLLVFSSFCFINTPHTVLLMSCRVGVINTFPTIEYMSLIVTFGCAVNPVLYSMRSTYFRQGLKRLFHIKPSTVGTVMPLEVSTFM